MLGSPERSFFKGARFLKSHVNPFLHTSNNSLCKLQLLWKNCIEDKSIRVHLIKHILPILENLGLLPSIIVIAVHVIL